LAKLHTSNISFCRKFGTQNLPTSVSEALGCGSSPNQRAVWEEAGFGAVTALQARLALWDGILNRMRRLGH
jgi:hypothetical protein